MARTRARVLVIMVLCLASAVATAADWQAGADAEWARTLAAAKAEGALVVASSPDMAKPMTDGFLRDTGIRLTFLGGDPRDIFSRVAREVRGRSVTIDLILGGSTALPLVKEGFATPIKPQLILPGVTDPGYWADGEIRWIDKSQTYMLQGAEYVYGQPFLNTDSVKPGTLKNWTDMLKPEFVGKIAAMDPRSPGSGQATAAYLASLFGTDFIKALYLGQKTMLTANARQVVEWAARGVYPIALGGSSTDLEAFRTAGIRNLVVGDMGDGPGSTVGGFSVIWQPKGNPHPNAAKIFLNWYASKPGQEAYVAVKGTPTRRTDVDVSGLPDYLMQQPGKNYLDTYGEEFYFNVRPTLATVVENALGGK